MRPVSIFIVDDHFMVIEGIRSLLRQEESIEWMGHATNAASCLAMLRLKLPDVLLLDINMPDTSGITLCKEIKEKYPSVYVIGLSTFNEFTFIEKMVESGASGYLLKNAGRQEILEAIFAVIKGRKYLSAEASATLRKREDNRILLTRREREVLSLIAEGLTNHEIAEKIFVSVSTVDSHRKSLLAKFGSKNVASMVKAAMLSGLL